MDRKQQAYNKICKLQSENNEIRQSINNIFKQKEKLTYMYIDIPNCDAKLHSQELSKLEKFHSKCIAKLDRNNTEISRLRLKYGI